MRVGIYSDHLRKDGQVGTGTSKYIYYLTKELRDLAVDVVPLHKGENPGNVDVLHDPHAPWNAPLRPRLPLVITIHDLAPATCPEYFDRWVRFLFLRKMRWFARRAGWIIADSNRSAQVVQTWMRPNVPVSVVPLGVESKFREVESVPPPRPYVAQVGVHRKIKEPWTTVHAFEAIADRVPHELHFVGERPPWLKPLESYVASRPALMDRVRFVWPGEDGLPSLYSRTSLVVHPCPEEGFGFVPLEALACGAHVLARAPAVREILGPYGCYFDDSTSLPDKILECLSDGARGTPRERSTQAHLFTFRQMAEQTLAVYEEAVQ